MTEFVFMMFIHGWPVEVDRFKTLTECQSKVLAFHKSQSGNSTKVWCEEKMK